MFPEMRKKTKQISQEEAMKILAECEYCTLATYGEDSWPYITPLSYIVREGKVYFHCATKGRKLDNIAFNPKVCLNVVENTEPVWDDDFTTYYDSVTAFGTAKPLEEGPRKREILIQLVDKYLPDYMEHADRIIEQTKAATAVVEITLEHVTGKAKKRP